MIYISKGIAGKDSTMELVQVLRGSQIIYLSNKEAELWLRGRFSFALTKTSDEDHVLQHLICMGVVEAEAKECKNSEYWILTRCICCPAIAAKRSLGLSSDEKAILFWLRNAGIRLSTAELIYLIENHIEPESGILHTENRQTLIETIYTTETDDGHGNIVQTETTVTHTYLYITVSHKTIDEMAAQYGFNQEQKDYLTELLKDENNSMWSAVLYGISYSDGEIVTVALSQVGNMGGEPYWSWYGFNSRVEWCACFVSWCANECGYIDTGVIPKFAGCVNGSQWFKDRGQWQDESAEPVPGMIIFFDWESDGEPDHVGIVEKVENDIIYTVEGNSGDACKQNNYSIGSSVIYY